MNTENRLKLSLNVAVVAGIFCGIVALLLLLNFLQINKQDPLETKAMEKLIERLSQDPNDDALKSDIRTLDLLARKAYFNSWWQVKTGSYLLLAGAIVLALALRYYYSLLSKIEFPDLPAEKEWQVRLLSQRWVIITGAIILLAALGASFASKSHLDQAEILAEAANAAETPADSGIEVIEVGTPQSTPPTADSLQAASPVAAVGDSAAAPAAAAIVFPDIAQVKANAPSFRGPLGNGVYSVQNVPVDFDIASGKNLLWKVSVPLPGYNSPVIWGDKIFLSGANAQKREIFCFSRSNGKLLWTAVADNIQGSPAAPPKVTEDTGLAAPSVATDGNHVYAIFATGDVIALDMSGKRVWARNLGVPDNHYGHSSSLILWKDKLYVQYDTNKGRKLIALEALTGNTKWETNRNVKISWASPIVASIGGKYQVILSSDPLVAGYDAETGKEMWTTSCLSGEVGPSPAFGEGLVFAANEYATLAAINPVNGQITWQADEYLPEVASPVVSGGLLFIATTYGILACYDAKSGQKLWEHDGGVGYYSSPVVADGKLFAFDLEGKLDVFAVAREKNLLAESPLGAKVTSTPSFAAGRMFIRAGGSLYCFGNK